MEDSPKGSDRIANDKACESDVESHVEKRTEELRRANEELRGEIRERVRTEAELASNLERLRRSQSKADEQMELIRRQRQALEELAWESAATNEKLTSINAVQSLILENSTLGIALIRESHFEWANGRLAEMLGLTLEQIQGLETKVMFPSDQVQNEFCDHAHSLLAQGIRADITMQLCRSNRSLFWCRSIGKALDPQMPRDGSIWMFEDITEQRKAEMERQQMEVQLRQAQKLESVGRLAAGVAHEINTPIQFVNDSVHFLRGATDDLTTVIKKYQELIRSPSLSREEVAQTATQAEEDADLDYLLLNIPKAVERSLDGLGRVATIVRSMKDFAHPDQKEMAAADLNRAIQSTLTIARNEYKYVAEVETDLGELPMVTCHIGDINQVVLNIIINAAHAIGDVVKNSGQKGRITVRTRRDGNCALISIGDTGNGIPADIRDKVYEPFFTTKEVGKGTGQGLAIARATVVEKHGGELRFETEIGKGTTFFIRLPVDASQKMS